MRRRPMLSIPLAVYNQYAQNRHYVHRNIPRFSGMRLYSSLSMSLCLLLLCLTACFPWSPGQSAGNRASIQLPPKSRLNYVAIGASDTFGTGTDDPQTQSWPVDLAAKLGAGVHLVNLGIPGIVAHDAVNVELPVALDAHPDLVTVWLAVNDLVDNAALPDYAHDLDTLFSRLQSSAPHARIVAVNVPDLTLLPSFQHANKAALETKIAAYNSIISDIITRHHVLLVDLFQQWNTIANHPEYISDDGFHPNALGYAQLANIVYQTMQRSAAA